MTTEELPVAETRFDQFTTRQLLVVLTAGAILAALLAPGVQQLGEKQQRAALLQVVIALGVFGGVAAYFLYKFKVIVAKGGPLVQRFERKSSRYWFWFNALALLAWNLVHCWLKLKEAQERDEFIVLAFHPYALVLLASYLLIRGWWNINPKTLEVRENGMVHDFRVVLWDEIKRYTWSGTPTNQLNLFLKSNYVNNLRVDPKDVAELDRLLAPRFRV